jgi:hypothetical protein
MIENRPSFILTSKQNQRQLTMAEQLQQASQQLKKAQTTVKNTPQQKVGATDTRGTVMFIQ